MSNESGNSSSPIRGAVRTLYKDALLKHLYPDRYRAACREPIMPGLVVFLEIREKNLSDNFRVIHAALERRNSRAQEAPQQGGRHGVYTLKTISIGEGIEKRLTVTKNCLAAIPVLAKAQFIFINESSYFFSSLPIRPQTTVIQTWHGCGAFKKFGYSAIGKAFGTTRKDLDTYPVHRNFSYVTVSSPEVVWAYAEAFHMEGSEERILPIGVSRTDMFFSRKYREKAYGKASWILRRLVPQLFVGNAEGPDGQKKVHGHELYAMLGDYYSDTAGKTAPEGESCVVPGKKIILYAPTFRGTVAHASAPDCLDLIQMRQELRQEYILLIKHHPFVRPKDRPPVPALCRDFAFDVTEQLSIEELLTVADICITDYSSLIFEYSLFERPMVFFAYDMQEYLDERGFYYPMSEMMPGPVCARTREVVDYLKNPLEKFDLARVREFKYRFMSACDGHATSRILKLMDRCSEDSADEE